jgi:aryl-alcohol dehydrogenase-like predicted oxidoreductase
MEYRQLGHSGVRVSVVGLGANRFGSEDVPQAEVNKIIDTALDSGVNFVDSANVYNDGAKRTNEPGRVSDKVQFSQKNQRQQLGRIALSDDAGRRTKLAPPADRSDRALLLSSLG